MVGPGGGRLALSLGEELETPLPIAAAVNAQVLRRVLRRAVFFITHIARSVCSPDARERRLAGLPPRARILPSCLAGSDRHERPIA
jgi:hypothetical protein